MPVSRYSNDAKLNQNNQYGFAKKVSAVRRAIRNGGLRITRSFVLTGADRLDALAGSIYGDARYWWLLAAASDIGWGLQVPPGTIINVVSLSKAEEFTE